MTLKEGKHIKKSGTIGPHTTFIFHLWLLQWEYLI